MVEVECVCGEFMVFIMIGVEKVVNFFLCVGDFVL